MLESTRTSVTTKLAFAYNLLLESTSESIRSVVARDKRTCGTLLIWQNHVLVTVPVRAPSVLPSLLPTRVGGNIHRVADEFAEPHNLVPTDPRRHTDVPPAHLFVVIRNPSG